MIVTDPLETAEAHAVARIRRYVGPRRAAVAAWEPRPCPPASVFP